MKDKAKVVLDLSSYPTNKKLYHDRGIDTSDLAAKKYFIFLKAEDDKLCIKDSVNVPTSLINLKAKVNELNVGKFKTFLVALKEFSYVIDNEVVENTKLNTLSR